jgi:hypothetical protein
MALDIESIFSHHPPKNDRQADAHHRVRKNIKMAAHVLNAELPESAEKTLAIRHLQMAMMFANSAIAQYGVNGG